MALLIARSKSVRRPGTARLNYRSPIQAPQYRSAVKRLFRRQGLGLGLYIASEIARAHGGKIDVGSSPAETRFTFRMPA